MFDRLREDDDFSRRVMIAVAAVAAVIILVLAGMLAAPHKSKDSPEAPAAEASEAEADTTAAPAAEASEAEADIEADTAVFLSSQFGEARSTLKAESKKIAEEAIRVGSDPFRDKPKIDPDDWMFILANPWNDISDYEPELETLEGQQFDVRIIEPMRAFVEAARDEGLSVYLSSGYRSYATQNYLFNRKAAEYGEAVAETIVARPGTSEHQTGLCCDITDRYYEMKDESLEDTDLYQWMSEHGPEYGFIVRFPKGREDVTGIIYEPWHFRYVGVEAAQYITEHDLTLEEFLALYDK